MQASSFEALSSAVEHRSRAVDACHIQTSARQWREQPARAARQLEQRPAEPTRKADLYVDVVCEWVVLPVVQAREPVERVRLLAGQKSVNV